MVERREKEEVQQGLYIGHRKQRPLFPFVLCVCVLGGSVWLVCVGLMRREKAGEIAQCTAMCTADYHLTGPLRAHTHIRIQTIATSYNAAAPGTGKEGNQPRTQDTHRRHGAMVHDTLLNILKQKRPRFRMTSGNNRHMLCEGILKESHHWAIEFCREAVGQLVVHMPFRQSQCAQLKPTLI